MKEAIAHAPTAGSQPNPALHLQLEDWVARDRLRGVSYAVLRGAELVDSHSAGWADREAGVRLRPDHIMRAFSNTKLITAVATLLLMDEGHFGLDDPVKEWIPALAAMRVLRAGALSLDDSEPARMDISIRHLLTHTAGFSHGVFDPDSLLYKAYHARGLRRPDTNLAELMALMGALPLQFEPGTDWSYSMSPDVLARLVEVVSGQTYGEFLQQRVFGPLGMVDTGFVLRPDQRPRFAALYCVADPARPISRGLKRLDDTPYPGAWLEPRPRQSGAGGLFTTQADMLALVRSLAFASRPGVASLLKATTVAEMLRDQLPADRHVMIIPGQSMRQMGFSLCGAVTRSASAFGGEDSVGEVQWGGLAGTHWWIAPAAAGGQGLAGVLMTQRLMAFWHPFWFSFKRQVHAAYR